MPRYYFDIIYDDATIADEEGDLLDSDEKARGRGEQILREVVANCIRDGRLLPRSLSIREDKRHGATTITTRSLFPDKF